MDDGELEDLATKLGHLVLRGLGARSAWALNAACSAAEVDGIAGVIAIKIPARKKDYIDVVFTAGAVDVVSRWGESVA